MYDLGTGRAGEDLALPPPKKSFVYVIASVILISSDIFSHCSRNACFHCSFSALRSIANISLLD